VKLHVTTTSPDETRALGARVGALLRPGDVVVLDGGLGAGKTVFAKGVADALGVTERVVSPSFAIVREYEGRVRMLHVDVYRLERFQEVHDLGLDDELGEQAVTVVEWGGRVGALLPPERLVVRIEAGDHDDERHVVVEAAGPSWNGRAIALTGVAGGR
jgi:tRNA threonylcarbamoyladenosine biosynthesis protein TsaE